MILILGCGFLGTHLIPALRKMTAEPIIATSRTPAYFLPASDAAHFQCDVTDPAALSALAEYGIEDGYVQELSAAGEEEIPAFDGTGV